MKKILLAILISLPLMATAQTVLTPQQELEQAQKQLEVAKKALEQAKKKAAEAENTAEIKKKIAATQKEIEVTKVETERLKAESYAKKKTIKAEEEYYIHQEAVPEENGKVQWKKTFLMPSLSAEAIYNKALNYLTRITQEENQLKNSQIVTANPSEYSILATYYEKLVFSSTALSYDHSKFHYVLQVVCSEGKATLTMSRLTYDYKPLDKEEHYTAEEKISNKVALNKKGTRMLPINKKFRRATIDRKNEIFDGFKQMLSEGSVNILE